MPFVIVAVGNGLTVTSTGAVALVPTVTVFEVIKLVP